MDSLVPPTWEPTPTEIDVATRGSYIDGSYGAMLRAVGPMIAARALREAADTFADLAASFFLVADRNLAKDFEGRLRCRAAALEGRAHV